MSARGGMGAGALLPSVRACVQCVPGPDFTLLHGVNKKQMKQLLLARKKKNKKKEEDALPYAWDMGCLIACLLPAQQPDNHSPTHATVSVVPFE